mmetsp:Transcript_2664/g.3552  ORF Transcript_2664/g.3552 Transcript_2664/m.3552 type:complete len:374 (-) Transcript_2664:220-1341(-)
MNDDTEESGYSKAYYLPLKKNFANIAMWVPKFVAQATLKKYVKALPYETGKVDPDMPASTSEVFSDKEDQKKADKALWRNEMAMSALTLSFTDQKQMQLVTGSKSDEFPEGRASIVWKGLMKKYRPNDMASAQEGEDALKKIKMKEKANPADLISDLIEVKYKYPKAEISDERLLVNAFRKAPEKYKSLLVNRQATIIGNGEAMTLDDAEEVMTTLYRTSEQNKEEEEDSDEEEGEAALSAFKKNCYHCNLPGHKAYQCPKKKNRGGKYKSNRNNKKKFQGNCHHCGKKGHRKQDCFQLVGYPGSDNNNSSTNEETGNAGIEYCLTAVDYEDDTSDDESDNEMPQLIARIDDDWSSSDDDDDDSSSSDDELAV